MIGNLICHTYYEQFRLQRSVFPFFLLLECKQKSITMFERKQRKSGTSTQSATAVRGNDSFWCWSETTWGPDARQIQTDFLIEIQYKTDGLTLALTTEDP